MRSAPNALALALALFCARLVANAQAPDPTPGTCVVVGRVLGQNAEPMIGAGVWATGPETPGVVVRRTRTDGEGAFVLGRFPMQQLIVHAKAARTTTAQLHTSIEHGIPEIWVDLRLWEARTLRGRVLDSEGKPIAGAALLATKDTMPGCACEGSTDAEGQFALAGAPIGDCALRVLAAGCLPSQHSFDSTTDEQIELRIDRCEGVKLQVTSEGLPPEAAVATRVHLQASSVSGRLPRSLEQPLLHADGTCLVQGLPEMEWHVSLQHPDYRFEPDSARAIDWREARPLHFYAIRLDPITLRGRLLANGMPLAARTLRLQATSSPTEPSALAATDAEGRFTFATKMRAGDPFLLQLAGTQWVLQPKVRATRARYLHCHEGVVQPDREVELTAVRSPLLRGQVVDVRGHGVPFLAVELQGSQGRPVPQWSTVLRTASGRDGGFVFEGVQAYDFDVRITASGLLAVGQTDAFVIPADSATTKTVATVSTGCVEGLLTRKDGEPIAGGRMTLSGPKAHQVMTGRDGRFVFFGLPPGEYRLSAKRAEEREQPEVPEPFEVGSGQNVRRDLQWR